MLGKFPRNQPFFVLLPKTLRESYFGALGPLVENELLFRTLFPRGIFNFFVCDWNSLGCLKRF